MTMRRPRRPTTDTRFHIDAAWWEQVGRDFRVYLHSALCPVCQGELASTNNSVEPVDYVDPQTGEVRQLNELWARLLSHCSQQSGYIDSQTPLTAAIFRWQSPDVTQGAPAPHR
jgi:hypothetical protein